MSPSVNHPLSSRAALVPAMLVGAAVALALLAIPSAAASEGPGEWLLTGLENRWKWGADWTPEFGPWAWLVFAPATAETCAPAGRGVHAVHADIHNETRDPVDRGGSKEVTRGRGDLDPSEEPLSTTMISEFA